MNNLKPRNQTGGTVGSGDNATLIESYYEQWQLDPASLDPTWRSFFEGFELGCQQKPAASSPEATRAPASPAHSDSAYLLKQANVYNLLFAYRTLGHHLAKLDPLNFTKPEPAELDLKQLRLDEADLDTVFDSGRLGTGGPKTLREIISVLQQTYCGHIGVEYMHIQNFQIRRWLRDRMETSRNTPDFPSEKKKRVLNKLLSAEAFERFLHTRYVGQKRFSLEGGETLIPMLDALVEKCPAEGVSQIVMGMAHRGRLNVLANILGKTFKSIFNEFAENYIPESPHGDGDVKYHVGHQARVTTSGGTEVGLSLAPNPSHLELVNPVVEGKARAWQRILNDTDQRSKVLPVLIHGDAAFIGQGIVAETLNLSQLPGYKTGGTLHIVVNNQIGFTTIPADARSTQYCTALAKMLGVPIFHVNGDDPVSAVYLIELALTFRQQFKKDIVIDLVCYRRHGHNEGDEPSFTQPTLYNEISKHPQVSEVYLGKLLQDGVLNRAEVDEYKHRVDTQLNEALAASKAAAQHFAPSIRPPISTADLYQSFTTRVSEEILQRVGGSLARDPEHIAINSKLARWLQSRRDMLGGAQPIDWAFAEALALGTLLDQGTPVRLSGQDSRRGTFSQRHSVFYDINTRERYIPLKNISPNQATFCVYNSPLSEAAVLGFDFGYTLDFPNMLLLWEAQFGDFVNGAQNVIDQYLTSSESKWGVTSNIVLLLPHGYHGQGPEHTSARLERFLQACAEDNIQVANPTTPANYFHLLRRQALRPARKPLIVMTPKGMLRDKRCVSALADFTDHDFREILDDPQAPETPKRVIFCQGKVYHDLNDYRKTHNITDTALVRIEQLYPIRQDVLQTLWNKYQGCQDLIWCQEESKNMGAWFFMEPVLRHLTRREVRYAGRDASASPATGSLAIHELEQKDLVIQAYSN